MDQNDKLQKALGDISVIKQTMQKSRVQMEKLSRLFFLYGGSQLLLVGGWLLSWLFLRNTAFYMPLIPFLWIVHASYPILSVVYFVWRRGLKKTENNYTIYLYDIWGYALFTVPLIWVVCFLTDLIFPAFMSNAAVESLVVLFWLAEQLIFFLGIAVMGFLLNSRGWKIFSVVCIILYFLSFLWIGGSMGSLQVIPASELIGNYWGSVQVVWMAICPAIALLIGFYFLPEKKK